MVELGGHRNPQRFVVALGGGRLHRGRWFLGGDGDRRGLGLGLGLGDVHLGGAERHLAIDLGFERCCHLREAGDVAVTDRPANNPSNAASNAEAFMAATSALIASPAVLGLVAQFVQEFKCPEPRGARPRAPSRAGREAPHFP